MVCNPCVELNLVAHQECFEAVQPGDCSFDNIALLVKLLIKIDIVWLGAFLCVFTAEYISIDFENLELFSAFFPTRPGYNENKQTAPSAISATKLPLP